MMLFSTIPAIDALVQDEVARMAPKNPYDFSENADRTASMGITGLLAMIKKRYALDARIMSTIKITVH